MVAVYTCLTTRVLQIAARGKYEEFVRVYTADPQRLNVQDSRGQRPLHAAAARGHKDIVDFIIKQHGCKPESFFRMLHRLCQGKQRPLEHQRSQRPVYIGKQFLS